MPYEFQYRIHCDNCALYNKRVPNLPNNHYLCALKGQCPGMADTGDERRMLYKRQLDRAVSQGTAERVT